MANIEQHKEFAVYTPLGENALLLSSLQGTEQLSRPFEYRLGLASEDHQINLTDMIGQNVTVRLELSEGNTRYFNGFVSRFTQIPGQDRLARYEAILVPWLWFLTRTADCRIFQDMTVPDIIKKVFRERGFTNMEDSLTSNYRVRKYCVQYRETDFDFVSRLMEQEGIYYFFKQENGKHSLSMADAASAHQPYPDYEEIIYHAPTSSINEKKYITQFSVQTQLQPCLYALKDFDFENTKKDLQVRAKVQRQHTQNEYEIYDYTGEYIETSDGEAYARKRIEELQAQYEVMSAVSDARGISPGCTFTLTDHIRDDQNRKYLITSTQYNIDVGDFYSTRGSTAGCEYSCNLTAIDVVQPFRAPRTTPKPTIAGPQTAMVVGPSGEEIYTDQHGRVKVQFHWDRYGKADENSSCWIRVAQVWAGKQWGAMYIPRIGQEVIIEFLEGDPDQPIITGRVYNGQSKPPYDLPAEKTKSTIKSNSSKGGGGFNEIRLEDKKGDEQIFIHGEKDEDVRIKNDSKEWIGNDRHLIVKNDQFEKVKGDKHLTVKGDQNEKVDGTVSLTTGMDLQQKVGMNHALEAGQEIHIKAGMKVIIEAGLQLTIKAAGGFVDIGPAGVTIQGNLVNINSGGAAGSGSGCSPDSAKPPLKADTAEPGQVSAPPKPSKPPKPTGYSPQAAVLQQAAKDGTPFCEQCAKAAKGG